MSPARIATKRPKTRSRKLASAASILAKSSQTKKPHPFATDAARWRAVVERNSAAAGSFYYAVKTTGVFCRCGCPARRPLRRNVLFFATVEQVQQAGYRACERCRPTQASLTERHTEVVTQVCRLIEVGEQPLGLNELAAAVGMSPFHLQRVFKAATGVTPKSYAVAQRTRKLRNQLASRKSVTGAIYTAGYPSSGRFYAEQNKVLGMTPSAYRAGGLGLVIRFAVGECWLGSFLVAATERGVCAILLGDDPETLLHDVQDRFPQAEFLGGDAKFERLVARVVGCLEQPNREHALPLDIRGTAFQQRVWQELRAITPGSTATYTEIAQRIGRPGSIRAVASACAANALAVAIPCHRVVRTDGNLAGYRWGIERKSKLLARERQ